MRIKVIVFDFDGTLVDSQQKKLDAFCKLFPTDSFYDSIISGVLKRISEAPRFDIIREILKEADDYSSEVKVCLLASEYNNIVVKATKYCPEMPGASKMLKQLKGAYKLYISSTTPVKPLREIIEFRELGHYFVEIYGFPEKKESALSKIIKSENVSPDEVLVVGDGQSDMLAAQDNDCLFYKIDAKNRLQDLAAFLYLLA